MKSVFFIPVFLSICMLAPPFSHLDAKERRDKKTQKDWVMEIRKEGAGKFKLTDVWRLEKDRRKEAAASRCSVNDANLDVMSETEAKGRHSILVMAAGRPGLSAKPSSNPSEKIKKKSPPAHQEKGEIISDERIYARKHKALMEDEIEDAEANIKHYQNCRQRLDIIMAWYPFPDKKEYINEIDSLLHEWIEGEYRFIDITKKRIYAKNSPIRGVSNPVRTYDPIRRGYDPIRREEDSIVRVYDPIRR